MTESELLKVICHAGGVSHQHDEQTTQPGSVTAENYARVVAEVMWRDGIELNGQDCLVIRTKVLAIRNRLI